MQAVPDIAWGKHTRVILNVGCGVASFGGYLFERDVLTVSFKTSPKDEHEAQFQFALERRISAVMGSQWLPFPSRVFDNVHGVEFPGMQKVVTILKSQYFNSNLTTLSLRFY